MKRVYLLVGHCSICVGQRMHTTPQVGSVPLHWSLGILDICSVLRECGCSVRVEGCSYTVVVWPCATAQLSKGVMADRSGAGLQPLDLFGGC